MSGFGFELIGREELIKRFSERRQRVATSVYDTMFREMARTAEYVRSQKLSGQVLRNRTGNLRNSISSDAQLSGNLVTGRIFVGKNVPYARIHEFGGTTKPHVIEPKNKQALMFQMGGKTVFARRVNHPGSKIPERSYMRSSMTERKDAIIAQLKTAVADALQ